MVQGNGPMTAPDDRRAVEDQWNGPDEFQPEIEGYYLNDSDVLAIGDFFTSWWPNSSAGTNDGSTSDVMVSGISTRERYWPNSGANGRLGFVGVTRDQYGSAIGGCTVRCFRLSTLELTSQVVSDASTGAFTITSPYSEAHFLTVHLTGTPNIAGATVDTLIPA
jgi:hypothetical protein